MVLSQDERNLKELKLMLADPKNRNCSECGAIYPQYANVIAGTFICEKCSDLLREVGQRTKPVNTATFTSEEMDMLRTRGNKTAFKIWMGNWNPTEAPFPNANDTTKFREFLRLKYAERRFYDPQAELDAIEEAEKANNLRNSNSNNNSNGKNTGNNGKRTRVLSAPPQQTSTNNRSWYDGISDKFRPTSVNGVTYSEVEETTSVDSLGPTNEIPTLTWSAKVIDNTRKEDGSQAYIINVSTSLGGKHTVKRTYEEFFDFQCALLDGFPDEAGTHGGQRIIPYLPGKKVFLTARGLLERQKELNEYVQELALLPERVKLWEKFQDFFCLGGS